MRQKKQIYSNYRVFIYRPHHSGIGSTLIKELYIQTKPFYDICDFLDSTNGVWSFYEGSDKLKAQIEKTRQIREEMDKCTK